MSKEVEVSKTRTDITTFKARIKASKPHYVPKVMSRRLEFKDCLKPQFSTYMTAFVPKLKPTQQRAVCMLHFSNGAGSCWLRASSPVEIAEKLREMADILMSNQWLEKWENLADISEKLITTGEVLMDDAVIDVGDFKKSIGLKKSASLYPGMEVVD